MRSVDDEKSLVQTMGAAVQGLFDALLLAEVDDAVLRCIMNFQDEKLLDDSELLEVFAELGDGCSRVDISHVELIFVIVVSER